jgi:hypothetical protein
MGLVWVAKEQGGLAGKYSRKSPTDVPPVPGPKKSDARTSAIVASPASYAAFAVSHIAARTIPFVKIAARGSSVVMGWSTGP